jgi:NAD(P)-dependent dehydrogenase (short-subunit alcohol dehydrogenase family)
VARSRLTRADMLRLFALLDDELAAEEVSSELYLVGGAVMCLALDVRDATRDVDAFFRPTAVVRQAARRVAARAGVADDWLNDAVKGFLGSRGEYEPFLDLDHLKVFVARPAYLLAMKCAAMRLGEEFHDVEDVRFLLRVLDLTTVEEALAVVTRYFDEERLPAKTRLALEELMGAS